jgi:hypothetical protein
MQEIDEIGLSREEGQTAPACEETKSRGEGCGPWEHQRER